MATKNFIEELEWRGMIHTIMPGAKEQLEKEMTTAYLGIDPTADSLHIGHLVGVMILKHFQMCGHRPLALIGGATGMIGDPSGKSQERNLLDEKTLRHNQEAIKKQLAKLPRREIAQASIDRNGLIVVAEDMMQAMRFANVSAPEHMELLTAQPFQLLPYVRHAGAVFLGAYSPEPLGDYFAGPNHVLPTGGTARYYSVLNVETFMKRTSIISYTQPALSDVSEDIIRLAETEGLQAHANAIRIRRETK